MTTATSTFPYHPATLIEELTAARKFFLHSTSVLTEEHAGFAPKDGLMTVALQVAHVAQASDWSLSGLSAEGFDADFEAQMAELQKFTSLEAARAELDAAFVRARKSLEASTPESLAEPLAENPFMNGPRGMVYGAIVEHTAHHRGVLSVYSRMLDLVPPVPYEAPDA